jgi:hypothetical protein
MFRVAALFVGLIVAHGAVVAHAQLERAPAPRTRPSARIDPLSASISGRITAADTGEPVPRAEVRLLGVNGINRIATTGADGRYELRDLPAGDYRIAVSKSGMASLQFGQRRPFEPARVIALKEGQQSSADVVLLRGGVIAGRVYDRWGEPVSGVRVNAMRSRTVNGRRRLQAIAPGDETDDTGAFRLYGLTPGDYYVAARQPQEGRAIPTPAAGAPPIFYPGTPVLAEAQRLSVTAMSEVNAVIQLVPVAGATVAGTVFDSTGAPVAANVTLASDSIGMGYVNAAAGEVPLMFAGHASPDGTFAIEGVPPGSYTVRANIVHIAPPGEQFVVVSGRPMFVNPVTGTAVPVDPDKMKPREEGAVASLVVGTSSVRDFTMTTTPGGTISGSFVRDPTARGELPKPIGVTVTSADSTNSLMSMRDDSTFSVAGVRGRVYVRPRELPDGWTVKSITANGTDVTDTAIDVGNGQDVKVRITLTDRITDVSGVVTPASRFPYSVLVFPEDPARWTYPSRYIRTVQTGDDGRFRIRGLAPAERYLAVALDYLEEGEGEDPELLERLRERAASFSLSEGESRTLELRGISR